MPDAHTSDAISNQFVAGMKNFLFAKFGGNLSNKCRGVLATQEPTKMDIFIYI